MRVSELAALYALIGAGCALGLLVNRRQQGWRQLVDALLLLGVWPLYGPLLLAQPAAQAAAVTGGTTLRALERAAGAPLASLLPDEATARALERRMALARQRVLEINALLAEPAFCEESAQARQHELEQRGDHRAAAAAQKRVQGIRHLRQLRDRFAGELAEIGELLVQLRVQAEVVRLAGGAGLGNDELVGELLARLEGLDLMLAEEPALIG